MAVKAFCLVMVETSNSLVETPARNTTALSDVVGPRNHLQFIDWCTQFLRRIITAGMHLQQCRNGIVNSTYSCCVHSHYITGLRHDRTFLFHEECYVGPKLLKPHVGLLLVDFSTRRPLAIYFYPRPSFSTCASFRISLLLSSVGMFKPRSSKKTENVSLERLQCRRTLYKHFRYVNPST
jgi:hypothetical protein